QAAFFPVVASHENGTHTTSSPFVHWPEPSQILRPVTASPSHAPGTHSVPIGYLRHAPCPSHVPSRPQVATSDIAHVVARRGFCPAGTGAHVPIDSWVLHAMHVSVQAVLQQTPSTQKPD